MFAMSSANIDRTLHTLQTNWEDFTSVRRRVAEEWTALPKTADVISPGLRHKMLQISHDRRVSAEN